MKLLPAVLSLALSVAMPMSGQQSTVPASNWVVATPYVAPHLSGRPSGYDGTVRYADAEPLSHVAQSDVQFVKDTLYKATVLLYGQDESGTMKMRCTATAIDKTDKGYVFATAAHCGCADDEDNRTVSPEKVFFFITPDAVGEKVFLEAKPLVCGYRHAGDDVFLLTVDTKLPFVTIDLGEDPKLMDSVVNVASPLGIGKQVFLGTVSAADLDRPVIDGDINWTHASLLQLFGTDGGSSGSAVVCLDQQKICGFVVGSIDKTSIIAMPVSRLIKLREQFAAGTYKHWVADPDAVNTKKK